MDGLLVIDKPQGLTSHDVVAAARRLLGESRIGHTGTLDPLATGVLPLVIGRATRLARFLASADKEYDATIRFGITTDSYDITGTETGRSDAAPPEADVARAIAGLTGEYLQAPPPFSAKKVGGRRAYDLARRQEEVTPAPVPVRVARAELREYAAGRARVVLTSSAGFYVRSFAHALGTATGAGACLEALRRTRSGHLGLDAALALDDLGNPALVASHFVPIDRLLPGLPAVTVTAGGRIRVAHGQELEPGDYDPHGLLPPVPWPPDPSSPAWIRLLDADGRLVGLATGGSRTGSLHPTLVLI